MIENLTDEQKAQLPLIRDEWINIGLSTEPTNKKEAEVGIDESYAAAGLTAPALRLWLHSPMAGGIGVSYLRALVKLANEKNVSIGLVAASVNASTKKKSKASKNVDASYDALWTSTAASVRKQLIEFDPPGKTALLKDVVDPAPDWSNVASACNECVYGQHDAGWLSFYDTFDRFGLHEETAKLIGLRRVAKNAGWWWPMAGAVIVTERPVELHRDNRGRLHNETGMAIRYSDGWGVYSIHGVRLSQSQGVKITTNDFGIADIDNEGNAEVRRVMIDIYNSGDIGKFLRDSGAKVVHSDVDQFGRPRKLLRREIADDEPFVAFEVTNSTPEPDGTYKTYTFRVHPELRPMPTAGVRTELGDPQKMLCQNAVASYYGMYGHEYYPTQET